MIAQEVVSILVYLLVLRLCWFCWISFRLVLLAGNVLPYTGRSWGIEVFVLFLLMGVEACRLFFGIDIKLLSAFLFSWSNRKCIVTHALWR